METFLYGNPVTNIYKHYYGGMHVIHYTYFVAKLFYYFGIYFRIYFD